MLIRVQAQEGGARARAMVRGVETTAMTLAGLIWSMSSVARTGSAGPDPGTEPASAAAQKRQAGTSAPACSWLTVCVSSSCCANRTRRAKAMPLWGEIWLKRCHRRFMARSLANLMWSCASGDIHLSSCQRPAGGMRHDPAARIIQQTGDCNFGVSRTSHCIAELVFGLNNILSQVENLINGRSSGSTFRSFSSSQSASAESSRE